MLLRERRTRGTRGGSRTMKRTITRRTGTRNMTMTWMKTISLMMKMRSRRISSRTPLSLRMMMLRPISFATDGRSLFAPQLLLLYPPSPDTPGPATSHCPACCRSQFTCPSSSLLPQSASEL
ncbi:hypothetical protein XENTR_v10013076 [Xenopus tropicalis]|nr:hypothetical protein XENTR_v10013076 [Xenopus tropicalis]